VLLWITGAHAQALLFASLTALLWIMHRGNIVRLWQGTESRIGQTA
jgi:acyl phosphate:glycerol-3-phosphate acyltransferase